MSKDEPHRIADDSPAGEATPSFCTTRRSRNRRVKMTISISFDESQQEFELWDYVYDLRQKGAEHFTFETSPDYKKRIQHYEIIANTRIINKFRLWLIKNRIKYKLDKG